MTIPHGPRRIAHIAALAVGCMLLLGRISAAPHAAAQTPDSGFIERVLASLTPAERVGQPAARPTRRAHDAKERPFWPLCDPW